MALCLALLRHPSGLGGGTHSARGFTSAASPQVTVTSFPASRKQRTAGQSTNSGHLALARLSDEASWLVPPGTAETRVSPARCRACLMVRPCCPVYCRIEPYWDQGGACGAAGPASAAGSALAARPPHAGPRARLAGSARLTRRAHRMHALAAGLSDGPACGTRSGCRDLVRELVAQGRRAGRPGALRFR